MKNRKIKLVSLLLAAITLISFLPIYAQSEYAPTNAVNFTNAASINEDFPRLTLLKAAARTFNASAAPKAVETVAPDGLIMNKKAEQTDGGFKITLEAYTTGSVTTQNTTKPADIILVIDQSGSMGYDLNTYTYTPEYEPKKNKSYSYYVKSGGSYIEINYCSRCDTWTDGCSHYSYPNNTGTKYYPMTSQNDSESDHVLFYTRQISETSKRLDALVNTINTFVASVEEKADEGADHRIALVGFSSGGFNNTELLTGVEITTANKISDSNDSYYPDGFAHNGVQYGSITSSQYQNALQDMSTEAGKASVKNAISALTAHGGTNTLDGLDMAYQILKNDTKKSEDRNKVVILFTDGATNSDPNKVVNKAYDIKNDYTATVYSVGIFDGANGDLSSHTDDVEGDSNTMMHAISSNYPDAYCKYQGGFWGGYYEYSSGDINQNLKDGESYYLTANDTEALNDIFISISHQIGSETLDLGSETVVKDVVSPYFDLPENTDGITTETFDCTGYNEETGAADWTPTGTLIPNSATIDSADNSVNISGFDFKANYVSEIGREEGDETKPGDFHGRKLVITLTVALKDGFWGGNNVPTNGEASGIYADSDTDEAIGTFRVPTVNIPIKQPTLTGTDNNIYLYGEAPLLKDLYTTNIPVSSDETWKTAYVNIDGPDFTDPSTVISNTEDTEKIGISVTVSPKYNGNGADCGTPAESKSASAEANVYVFKPTLTFKDTYVYYGDTVSDYSDNKVSEAWERGGIKDSEVTMFGTAPELSLEYNPKNGIDETGTVITKQDIPVNVKVKIGEQDINAYVKFGHSPCDPVCGFNADNEQFLLHVKTCKLTVSKNGGTDGEPYVFYIYKNGEKYTELTVTGNGSVSVYELPVGTYTVKEDTEWSWRFDSSPVFTGNPAELSAASDSGYIICTNRKSTDEWLNGFSEIVKNIFDIEKNS